MSQWDGAEFQPTARGWDIKHSANTFGSGLYFPNGWSLLWGGATLEAFGESRARWDQPLAVELSLTAPGFAPWRGDMTPFSDEQSIALSGLCAGGQRWVQAILQRVVAEGRLYNAYNTPVRTLGTADDADCFLGALVGAGIAPQILDSDKAAINHTLDGPIRFWLDASARYGHPTESSVDVVHYPDIYWSTLSGGSVARSYGLVWACAACAATALPALLDNATIVVYATTGASAPSIGFGEPQHGRVSFFGASAAQLTLSGPFWQLQAQDVEQLVTLRGGTSTATRVFGRPVSGPQTVKLALPLGATVRLTKVGASGKL